MGGDKSPTVNLDEPDFELALELLLVSGKSFLACVENPCILLPSTTAVLIREKVVSSNSFQSLPPALIRRELELNSSADERAVCHHLLSACYGFVRRSNDSRPSTVYSVLGTTSRNRTTLLSASSSPSEASSAGRAMSAVLWSLMKYPSIIMRRETNVLVRPRKHLIHLNTYTYTIKSLPE